MTAVAEATHADSNGFVDGEVSYTPPQEGTTGKTVIELLIEAMRKVKPVGKTQRNTQQNYNFRGIDDVVNAANPVFQRLGILTIPRVRSAQYRDVTTTKGNPSREVTVTVEFAFYGPRGDCLSAVVPGESMDSGDKGTPKAMSVALRVALIQVLMLPTKDLHPDPDSDSPERGRHLSARDAKEQRESDQPDRADMVRAVDRMSRQIGKAMGESEYTTADRMAQYCKDKCGTNIIAKVNEDGVVEELDWSKLNDGYLRLVSNAFRKKQRELGIQDELEL